MPLSGCVVVFGKGVAIVLGVGEVAGIGFTAAFAFPTGLIAGESGVFGAGPSHGHRTRFVP